MPIIIITVKSGKDEEVLQLSPVILKAGVYTGEEDTYKVMVINKTSTKLLQGFGGKSDDGNISFSFILDKDVEPDEEYETTLWVKGNLEEQNETSWPMEESLPQSSPSQVDIKIPEDAISKTIKKVGKSITMISTKKGSSPVVINVSKLRNAINKMKFIPPLDNRE